MHTMTGDSTFPRTLFILFLHFRLYTRGVKSCTDESACSTRILLEPAKCLKEGILSKCCLSCEKILRETEEKTDGQTSSEDNSKPLSQQVKLHPKTFKNKSQSISIKEAIHPSNETEHKEKARTKSTHATTYLRTLSTSDANVRLESTPSTPFTDMYHEKHVAVYNTNLIIGTNMGLVVFLTIIAILGIVIWKKGQYQVDQNIISQVDAAHRSRRHETIQVTDRRGNPVPPPRSISSKAEKETSNRSCDDTYDCICDGDDKDIDNQNDRTYMELIGEESPDLFGSTGIPLSSESQPQPDEITLLTEDNYLLPVKSCVPHTREHDELETGNGIRTIKPQNCVERENIHRKTTQSNDEISIHIYNETSV